jgi:hypothetical protein
MTDQTYSATRSAEVSHFGMQALWRLALWGMLATFALFTAVLSAYSHAGSQRQTASVTSGQGTNSPRDDIVEAELQPSESADETRRLAEEVRTLTADRDQLLTRVAALERSFDGVTGTIKRDRIAAPQPAQAQSAPQIPPLAQVPAQAQTPASGPVLPQAATQNPAPAATSRPETLPGPMVTASIATVPVTPVPMTAAPMTPPAPVATTRAPMTEAAISSAQMPGSQQSGASDATQGLPPDAANRAASSSPNLTGLAPAGEPTPSGLGVDVSGGAN